MSGRLTRLAVKALDALADARPASEEVAEHLRVGRRGEEEAYFHLRRLGYVMVARNYRSARRHGEIDLVGWDGDVLCFVEVKTRTARDLMPPEAQVDAEKRKDLAAMAREYLLRLESRTGRKPGQTPARFDVVSVYFLPGGAAPEITLFKNAFALR